MTAFDGRGPALRRLLRRLRHDSATPISGALLHLEIATRRLRLEDGLGGQVRESVEDARKAIEQGSVFVESLDQMILFAEEQLVALDLREALSRAIWTVYSRATERGLALATLAPGRPAWICVGRRALNCALESLVSLSVESAATTACLTWKVETNESEVLLTCTWASNLAPAARSPSPAELLAGWAIEAQGGRMEIEQNGATVLASTRFVRAQE